MHSFASSLLVILATNASAFVPLQQPQRRLECGALTEDQQLVDANRILASSMEWSREASHCLGLAIKPLLLPDDQVTVDMILQTCDELETSNTEMQTTALEFQRYELLAKLQRKNYTEYVATASFLSPSRIPRSELPNIQDVPYDATYEANSLQEDGLELVADCELEDIEFQESLLDNLLMYVFRRKVRTNTGGVWNDKKGNDGLLDQARTFMLQEGQTSEAQVKMVRDTLFQLMGPIVPIYRFFMSGIVPDFVGKGLGGKQVGPLFYAPWLTTMVTPVFFAFLVGPSRPNRRKDGQLGGLLVEKCKFLQESGCKGICLHQCKLPAQQFFATDLGLPLTVSPNFVTQECQWSFGEVPLEPAEDPSFPTGCLVGCESRKAMQGKNRDVCN